MIRCYDTLNGCYNSDTIYESVTHFFEMNDIEDFTEAELQHLTLEDEEEEYSKSLEDAFEDYMKAEAS